MILAEVINDTALVLKGSLIGLSSLPTLLHVEELPSPSSSGAKVEALQSLSHITVSELMP